jgi:hypothetical protein
MGSSFGKYAGTETCPTWVWAPGKFPLKLEAGEASNDLGRFAYGNLDPAERLLCRKYGQELYSYLTHAMTTDAEDELEEAKNATYGRLVALDRPELSLSQMARYSLDRPDERREDQVIEAYTNRKFGSRRFEIEWFAGHPALNSSPLLVVLSVSRCRKPNFHCGM